MKSPNPIFTHPTLQLLTKCKTLCSIKQVHAQMIATALALHTYPLSRLLLFSTPLASDHALQVFDQIPNPTVFLFNTFISSLINHRETHTHLAFPLYNRIIFEGRTRPNCYTYPSLFKACGSQPWMRHGRALHAHVLKFLGPHYDHFVAASLLGFYSNCGRLGEARYVFDQIMDPDLGAWNAILSAYARVPEPLHSGSVCTDDNDSASLQALHLFMEMQTGGVIRPNEMSMVALIRACANLGALSQGMWAHVYVEKSTLELNRYVGTALVDMYSKCGRLDLAYQLFDQLPDRDTFCFNAMIGGLAVNGFGHEAVELYEEMKSTELVPDDATFVVTMCACSRVGLVDEGRRIFDSMGEVYGIQPKPEHYGCLVDLLGRAGLLKEAEKVAREMPVKANAILWRSLLGAAAVHGDLEIGEVALKNLVDLEPEPSGNYVLLSNIYAGSNQWEDVNRLRNLMKERGINKTPGISLVDAMLIQKSIN